MRIIHVIASLETGGAQKLVHDLALSQKAMGEDVAVMVYYRSESRLEQQLGAAGINVLSLERRDIGSVKIAMDVSRIVKSYDIAHIHLFPSLYQLALASIRTKIPMVYTEHSTYNRRRSKKYLRPLERIVYSRYSRVIAISRQVQESLLEWLRPKDVSKFQVITNGVDLKKYADAEIKSVETLFGRSGLPVLMVSRFVPAKDQLTLIKAIRHIDNPDVFAAFAGDGDLLENAKRMATELGATDRCVFLGNRDDVPELIKASVAGVQSSHWEGFGLTAIEFMAAGKPVVASSVNGLKQVVEGAGEIFPAGDEIILAEKLNHLLSDKRYYDSVAERCIRRADKYDVSSMTRQYLKVYQDLLNIRMER